jgi:hypothetical protein
VLKLIIRLARPLIVLFVCAVGIIGARPYTPPAAMLDVLPNINCEAPCVLGIRPGFTDAETAMHLLEAHPLVGNLSHTAFADGSGGAIEWYWVNDSPEIVSSTSEAEVFYDGQGVIQRMIIPLQVPLAPVRLALGRPETRSYDVQIIRMNTRYPSLVYFYDSYTDGAVHVRYGAVCPIQRQLELFDAAVWLHVAAPDVELHVSTDPWRPGQNRVGRCTF